MLTLHFSTLVSHAGNLLHIGQTFFNESWNDEVFNTSPYTSDTYQRTLNSEDTIIGTSMQDGYSAYTR